MIVKKLLLLTALFCALLTLTASAQTIASADLKTLQKREDSLKALAKSVIVDSLPQDRMRSDSLFVRTLVRSLQVKNSFYYAFDSVLGISKIYAPDSAFRIFSWSISFDDYYARQRAAIQFKTSDGSLKLVPLRDYSEFIVKEVDSVRNKGYCIVEVYNNII